MKKQPDSKYWDQPWSLVQGCTPISPACDNCWCASEAHTRQHQKNPKIKEQYTGLTDDKGCFNGTIRLRLDRLDIPLKRKKPTVYAVWSDLFHPDVPDEFIEKALNVVYDAKQHTFLILTKRPERMRDFLLGTSGAGANFQFDNLWLGVTAENQEHADNRIPILLQVPAAKRFVSIEPMLGAIDFTGIGTVIENGEFEEPDYRHGLCDLDAIVLGGESGHGARPMHPDWARGVRDQCQAAGVPFFFKQWGEWHEYTPELDGYERGVQHTAANGDIHLGILNRTKKENERFTTLIKVGKKKAGRLLDGKEHNELPWREKG